MVDITPIINAIIALIAALVSAFLIPWLKSKVEAGKLAQYKEWVTIAVKAAEQIYTGTGRGEEKKKYVVEFLEAKGFKIDFNSIDNTIEAAVYEISQTFGGVTIGEAAETE